MGEKKSNMDIYEENAAIEADHNVKPIFVCVVDTNFSNNSHCRNIT